MSDKDFSLCNGEEICSSLMVDRGFAFGDGLFETVLWSGSNFPLLSYHLERLLTGCNRLKIAISENQIRDSLAVTKRLLLKQHTLSARVKIVVTRQYSARGCYPEKNGGNVYILASSFKPRNLEAISLQIANQPLFENPRLVGLKHLNRLNYVVTCEDIDTRDVRKEVLLYSSEKNVIETMHHNIFFYKEDTLYTPSLRVAGVEGIAKKVLIKELTSVIGLNVVEQNIALTSMNNFDSVFISNALEGVVPVKAIADKEYAIKDKIVALKSLFNERLGYDW